MTVTSSKSGNLSTILATGKTKHSQCSYSTRKIHTDIFLNAINIKFDFCGGSGCIDNFLDFGNIFLNAVHINIAAQM